MSSLPVPFPSPPQALWENLPPPLLPSSSISSVNQWHAKGAGSCQEDKAVTFPSGYSPSVVHIHPEEVLPEETHLLQAVLLPDCQEQRHPFSAQGMCTSIPSTPGISSAFPLLSSSLPPLGGPRRHAKPLMNLSPKTQGLCPSFHHLYNRNTGLYKA